MQRVFRVTRHLPDGDVPAAGPVREGPGAMEGAGALPQPQAGGEEAGVRGQHHVLHAAGGRTGGQDRRAHDTAPGPDRRLHEAPVRV